MLDWVYWGKLVNFTGPVERGEKIENQGLRVENGEYFCLSNQSEARGILERFFRAGKNTKISKNRTFLHSWNHYWQLDFCKTLGCSVLENGNFGPKSEIKLQIASMILVPIFYPGNILYWTDWRSEKWMFGAKTQWLAGSQSARITSFDQSSCSVRERSW